MPYPVYAPRLSGIISRRRFVVASARPVIQSFSDVSRSHFGSIGFRLALGQLGLVIGQYCKGIVSRLWVGRSSCSRICLWLPGLSFPCRIDGGGGSDSSPFFSLAFVSSDWPVAVLEAFALRKDIALGISVGSRGTPLDYLYCRISYSYLCPCILAHIEHDYYIAVCIAVFWCVSQVTLVYVHP